MLGFFKKVNISYGITVCNEAEELNTLLKHLIPYIRKKDEIIVLRDITTPDVKVTEVIEKYKHCISVVLERKLNNNFSEFKNNLIGVVKGNYLFQIDADEIPQQSLLIRLKKILWKKSYKYDCFSVPRINTVEGYAAAHVEKWNWKVDDRGYIDYPNHQQRIFALGKGIHWVNKVHEKLTGFKRLKELPSKGFDLCLLHPKKIERQIRQNDFYDFLENSNDQ